MLKRRLIPVLLLKNGRMVKGKQFADYRDTGDPVSAARIYNAQNADELVFIDIEATQQGRTSLLKIIEQVSQECFMPLTVGGGVRSLDDIRSLLHAGADKVLINSAIYECPELLSEASSVFGRQCLIAGVDVKRIEGRYVLHSHCGQKPLACDLSTHLKRIESIGAGEILINSIDRDGMMTGYDETLLMLAQKSVTIPVIAMGGVGNFQHLADAFLKCSIHAAACASLFHFGDNNPIRARAFLKNKGIPVKST